MNRRLKLLVVDDDPQFIEVVRSAVETKPYEVITASTREAGLDKVRRETPALIILGTLAPRGDAFELHRKLKDTPRSNSIPLLVVDARHEEHAQRGWKIDEGLRMDAEDYIARPIEPSALLGRIEKVLERAARKVIEPAEVLGRVEVVLQRVEKIEEILTRQGIKVG